MLHRRELVVYALPAVTIVAVATAFIFSDRMSASASLISDILFLVRKAIASALATSLEQSPERALVHGLLLGGTAQFTQYWKQVFAATGTTHLVAVSGANIAYVAAAIGWLMERTPLSYVSRSLFILVMVGAYTILVGAPASAVRAALMCAIAYVAALIGRFNSPIHALCGAVLVMLIAEPSIVHDIGFQLSCAATLGLIVSGSPDERTTVQRAAAQTIAATLFTMPIVLVQFGTFSSVVLITNVVVAPFVPLLTVCGVLSIFSTHTAAVTFFIAHGVIIFLETAAHYAGGVVSVGRSTLVAGIWASSLVCIVILWMRRRCVILAP